MRISKYVILCFSSLLGIHTNAEPSQAIDRQPYVILMDWETPKHKMSREFITPPREYIPTNLPTSCMPHYKPISDAKFFRNFDKVDHPLRATSAFFGGLKGDADYADEFKLLDYEPEVKVLPLVLSKQSAPALFDDLLGVVDCFSDLAKTTNLVGINYSAHFHKQSGIPKEIRIAASEFQFLHAHKFKTFLENNPNIIMTIGMLNDRLNLDNEFILPGSLCRFLMPKNLYCITRYTESKSSFDNSLEAYSIDLGMVRNFNLFPMPMEPERKNFLEYNSFLSPYALGTLLAGKVKPKLQRFLIKNYENGELETIELRSFTKEIYGN